MKEFQPELGMIIRELRSERRYSTQQALAEDAAVSEATIHRLENGKGVRPGNFSKVLEALDISRDDLISRALTRKAKLADAGFGVSNLRTSRTEDYDRLEIHSFFDRIDDKISEKLGQIYSPTKGNKVNFSAYRLFQSLTQIDLPPGIILEILQRLPNFLLESIDTGEEFTTSHVRAGIARTISALPVTIVNDTYFYRSKDLAPNNQSMDQETLEERKHEWAKRYSRKYGDPDQKVRIVLGDGSEIDLDFKFLKENLIPQMLSDCLGGYFSSGENELIPPQAVSEMSEQVLFELRRLNLYSIKYQTALNLVEDMATQPPNPWIVTKSTQEKTTQYDLERARAHLADLEKNSTISPEESWYRFREFVHHACSLTMGVYGGFLGHKHMYSLRRLQHWLSIEEDNINLWHYCELRHINNDLREVGSSKNELGTILKRIENIHSSRFTMDVSKATPHCVKLLDIAMKLYKRRATLHAIKRLVEGNLVTDDTELLTFSRDAMTSIYPNNKPSPTRNKGSEDIVGFFLTIEIDDGPLRDLRAWTLFTVYNNSAKSNRISEVLAIVDDQLNAHKNSDVGIVLCSQHLSARDKFALNNWTDSKLQEKTILCLSLTDVANCAHHSNPKEAFEALLVTTN